MKPKKKEIILACSPGSARPGQLIFGVIAGTGLPRIQDCSRLSGAWTWDYSEKITDEDWEKILPILKERIVQLFKDNTIRYGSW